MSRMASAALIILWSAAPALAQAPSGAWADKLFMSKTSHDFGTVARGAQLKFSFPMKNIYAVPLQIVNIKPSCGCVTATASKLVLQPEEEGMIDIVIDSRQFEGFTKKDVKVTVGPEYISTATLFLTATSRRDVVFDPGEVDFKLVPQGVSKVNTVEVKYAGALDWRIEEVVKPADAPLDIKIEQTYRTVERGVNLVGYRMSVKLNQDAPSGLLKHDLILKTNDPTARVLTLSVAGNVQAALQVAPKTQTMPGLKVNEPKRFLVQVTGNRPFVVTGVSSDGNDVKGDLPRDAATHHTLTLYCTPTSVGDLRRTVTIRTNLEGNSSVTFTLQGKVSQ